MTIPVLVLITAVAACIGSFLNVCIWRLPREESLIAPGSHCVRCGRAIAWYDNVPLVSYVWLGGRCRRCRAPIARRYPLVELLAAVLAVWLALQFGVTWRWAVYACLAFALIVVTFVDLSHRIIPDEITLPGLLLGVIASGFVPSMHGATWGVQAVMRSVLGGLVGCGSLYVTGWMGDVVFRKESLGGGDVKLLAMAGTVLGWERTVLAFFLAPLLSIGPGLVVLRRKGDHTIPYGPFLSMAILIALVWGQPILRALRFDELFALLNTLACEVGGR